MKYSNRWLKDQLSNGAQCKYLLFWGHQPASNGQVSASCFSQWWPAPFECEGLVYQTAEHWMMAAKARLFGDNITLKQIVEANSPAAAKKLGRKVAGFDPQIWNKQKFNLVVQGNYLKFSQHDDLKSYLLATGEQIIVEASPVDSIWGIGLAADHTAARTHPNGAAKTCLVMR